MSETSRQHYLALALRVLAAVFVLGFYPLTIAWPSGWIWHAGQSNYIEMMIALYATLGVFLFLAARNPEQHLSLISFTIPARMAFTSGVYPAIRRDEHFGTSPTARALRVAQRRRWRELAVAIEQHCVNHTAP